MSVRVHVCVCLCVFVSECVCVHVSSTHRRDPALRSTSVTAESSKGVQAFVSRRADSILLEEMYACGFRVS